MQQAIDFGPFDELSDPRVVARLAARAEERGWDGFFVWDHIRYRAPFDLVATLPPGTDLEPWSRAGLTWSVTDLGFQVTEAEVRAVIDAGPT